MTRLANNLTLKKKYACMTDPETAKKTKKESPTIDIYKAWCKGCGICVAFCPTGVLALDDTGYPYVKEPDKCIDCKWCEMRCPDFAITVEQEKGREEKTEEKTEEKAKLGTDGTGNKAAAGGEEGAGESIEE